MKFLERGIALAALLGLTLCPIHARNIESPSLFDRGYTSPTTSEAVRLLRRVPMRATLRQIKAILPRDTRYSWIQMSPMSSWKWNTLQFKGRFSGLLVFANDRAKYRVREADKTAVARWRATDTLHSMDVFLGPVPRDESGAQTVIITKRYVDRIARLLRQRGQRRFLKPGDGPGASGWSATWKLRSERELYFSQDYSYSQSDERPMLQLSFGYSHLYRE